MKKHQKNKNFTALTYAFLKGYRGCVLEGGSRSGKTWSGIDFKVMLASRYETNAVINVVKQTYNSFKTTLPKEMIRNLGALLNFCTRLRAIPTTCLNNGTGLRPRWAVIWRTNRCTC